MKKTWCIKFLLVFISASQWQCKKVSPDCIIGDTFSFIPYENPVWRPDGTWLAFNYSPIELVIPPVPPCGPAYNDIYPDSTGFYLINANGTGLSRIAKYYVYDASWSPDGNWLAFSYGGRIYKMQFTGYGFDTSHMIPLTDSANDFNPN